MIRSFIVESTCNNMRIDRWLRNKLGKVPQSLIEKSLRLGKIKINKKKMKELNYQKDFKDKLFNETLTTCTSFQTIQQKNFSLITKPKLLPCFRCSGDKKTRTTRSY